MGKKNKKKDYLELVADDMKDFWEERRMYFDELFGNHEEFLTTQEAALLEEYIHDKKNPVWKRILFNGKETIYEVSNIGDVRNIETGHILKKGSTSDGYVTAAVSVKENNKSLTHFVHRLVGMAFIPNPENKPQINHINGIKTCNWYKNLEWVTAKENTQHAMMTGLKWYYGTKGEENGRSVYSEFQVRMACEMLEDPKYRPIDISKKTGLPTVAIHSIRSSRVWAHISKDYKFHNKSFSIGEGNNHNKYSEKQIHEVCKLLEKGMYPKEIEKITGVHGDEVQKIRKGKHWTHISKDYNIKLNNISSGEGHFNNKYSSDQIHSVCKFLEENKLNNEEISKNTGVSTDTIHKIQKGKYWTEISSKYKIPKEKSITIRKSDRSIRILELLSQNKTPNEITTMISEEFGIPRRTAQMSMYEVKRNQFEKFNKSISKIV